MFEFGKAKYQFKSNSTWTVWAPAKEPCPLLAGQNGMFLTYFEK